MCQSAVLPFRWFTQHGWRNEQTGISWSSMKTIAKVCTHGGKFLYISAGWGKADPKATLQEMTWGSWWPNWTWASNMPSQQKVSSTPGFTRESVACRLGEAILLLCLALLRHTWRTVPSSLLPSERERWAHWSMSNKRPGRWLRVQRPERTRRNLWIFSHEKSLASNWCN